MHHSKRTAVVEVVLYKDRECSPGSPPGLFFQAKPNKDSDMQPLSRYHSFCSLLHQHVVLQNLSSVSPAGLGCSVCSGSVLVYCSGVCLLFELFCSSVKCMASRNKIIRLDCIWVLQNFCSVFTSILLSVCLHTSSKSVVFIRI